MRRIPAALAILFLVLTCQPHAGTDDPSWSIEARYTDSCSCAPTCPCLFGSGPTLGHCEGITLIEIVTLASRNALLAMIDHIVTTYGYTRQQAYIIAAVAVDLRIGQVVDEPNVGVSAVLPLDIFEAAAE